MFILTQDGMSLIETTGTTLRIVGADMLKDMASQWGRPVRKEYVIIASGNNVSNLRATMVGEYDTRSEAKDVLKEIFERNWHDKEDCYGVA